VNLHISWVDAFTDRPFTGNAAAICWAVADDPTVIPPTDLPGEWMQSLAAEFGISETAFVTPTAEPDRFGLRWFTPTAEVDLCGHATMAAAHAMVEEGIVGRSDVVGFETRSGMLTAGYVDKVVELDLPADPPSPRLLPSALASTSLAGSARWTGAGGTFVVAELADADAVRDFMPDLAAIAGLDQLGLLVTAPGDEPHVDYVLRFFAPKVGIDEDPVTGSAQCALGPLWAERLGRSGLEARQLSARGGALRVQVVGDRVKVGGTAVTVVRGTVPGPPSS
jgi:predicted PhzF superfamily epimerase YddE/YHI9